MSFKNYLNKYTTTCKLPGLEEELEIKPLTTGEMKKTLIHQNETDPRKIEEIIDTLISDSVLTSDFDINNVYLQDRYFLLIEIRKITKGNKYTFQFTCPQCQSQSITGIDLGELEVKTKPKNVDNIIYVAGDELSVELDHVKRGEQKDAHNKIDLSSVTNEDERDAELLLSTLAAGIKAVNSPDGREENLNFEDKKYIIENITGDSLDKIRQWYTDNWFGVNAVMKAKCQHCNYITDEQPIEISSNFFLNNMFSGGYDYISVIKEQITLARYSPGITWEDSENMLDFEREMAVDVLTNMINKEVEEMKKNMETNKK